MLRGRRRVFPNDRFFLLTILNLQETIAKNYGAYLAIPFKDEHRLVSVTRAGVKLGGGRWRYWRTTTRWRSVNGISTPF